MHQEEFRIANCGFRIEISQSSERFCTDPQSEILLWKGSLTGKAVVLKTTALVACRFDSCPFRQFTTWRRRLTVGQRFAKSPRIAGAGSTPAASAKVSAVRSSDSTGGCQRSSLTAGNPGPVAQRNESATLRRSRSHLQIVPGPPKNCRFPIVDLRLVLQSEGTVQKHRKQSAIGNQKSAMSLPA